MIDTVVYLYSFCIERYGRIDIRNVTGERPFIRIYFEYILDYRYTVIIIKLHVYLPVYHQYRYSSQREREREKFGTPY